jgi:uncharacterized protein (DUF983 family)
MTYLRGFVWSVFPGLVFATPLWLVARLVDVVWVPMLLAVWLALTAFVGAAIAIAWENAVEEAEKDE